ncbi:MAG TPA: serine--tRNA ligase [Planctomycetota bacterium]|nr:serine--tRNA ligase [Planctomycetota bacterium]
MLDMDFIRRSPDAVRKAIANKHEHADVDALLKLDEERRSLLMQSEQLRSRRNEVSKNIPQLKKKGENVEPLMNEMRQIGDQIKEYEARLGDLAPRIEAILLRIPNITAPDVPVGEDSNDNVQVKAWGERKQFSFTPRPHWEIAKNLGIISFEAATRITGTGFVVYTGAGARLERALYSWMLDLHTTSHGYTEVIPPLMVNRTSMTGTGQLPKLEEDMYLCQTDDLFLIPTAEVPVTNIHRDDVLDAERLPIYYTAYTPCFRREAGSYGKDTRGLLRVHQFDKVEMVKFVRPETSYDELESLLENAEAVLQALGLEYRVMKLCTGDLSFAAAKCYDIEIWAPGIAKYLEVSSCSNFEDFQARRANIRFREKGGKPRFVHTLNGSGTALARLVATLFETYQQADGSVEIPAVLRPYMGGMDRITPPSG